MENVRFFCREALGEGQSQAVFVKPFAPAYTFMVLTFQVFAPQIFGFYGPKCTSEDYLCLHCGPAIPEVTCQGLGSAAITGKATQRSLLFLVLVGSPVNESQFAANMHGCYE